MDFARKFTEGKADDNFYDQRSAGSRGQRSGKADGPSGHHKFQERTRYVLSCVKMRENGIDILLLV